MIWGFIKRHNFLDLEISNDPAEVKRFITYLQNTTARLMDLTKYCSAALGSTLFAVGTALVAAKDKLSPEILKYIEGIFLWAIFGILAAFITAICCGMAGMYLETGILLNSRDHLTGRSLKFLHKSLILAYRHMVIGTFILIGAAVTLLVSILNVISIALRLS